MTKGESAYMTPDTEFSFSTISNESNKKDSEELHMNGIPLNEPEVSRSSSFALVNELPGFELPVESANAKKNSVMVPMQSPLVPDDAMPLTQDELITIRQMISEFRKNTGIFEKSTKSETESSMAENPIVSKFSNEDFSDLFDGNSNSTEDIFNNETKTEKEVLPSLQSQTKIIEKTVVEKLSARQQVALVFAKLKLSEPTEKEFFKSFSDVIEAADDAIAYQLAIAVIGLLPFKKFLRHGTPEQKLFVLKLMGDRFLDTISGTKWPDRKKFVKLAAAYLSNVSETYSFISSEGEAFKPTLHERVLGTPNQGSLIREMRSFIVCHTETKHIVYTGQVIA